MPELPEVEVVRQGIDAPLKRARITGVRLGKPLRWPLGLDPSALQGSTLGGVSRRGKYLWLALEGGVGGGLLLHLGMSGSLALLPAPPPAGAHDHFDLVTTAGTLRLTDPRRFGAVVWSASLDDAPAARLLQRLGPEPFDDALTPQRFHAALRRRSAPVKAVLLSGEAVVGAGNIYACEALHIAGIHPALRADRISGPRAGRLLAAVRQTLAAAVEMGGSTLRDFRSAHGVNGRYQGQALVYGREGQPCPTCGTGVVRRIVQGQRATYYCPHCQKR